MRDRLVIVSLLPLVCGLHFIEPTRRPTTTTPVPPPLPFAVEDQKRAIELRLRMIWSVPIDKPAAARRARLFALWSDSDYEPDPNASRAQIERYIHEHVPATGADAFTDDELARFNLHRGRPPDFDPYGTWSALHQP